MIEFFAGFLVGALVTALFLACAVRRVADKEARQIAAAYGCDCVVARDGEFVWKESGRDD